MQPDIRHLLDAKRIFDQAERERERGLFISAYNENERVSQLFNCVNAQKKVWWILPEYGYTTDEYPAGNIVDQLPAYEADLVRVGLEKSGFDAKSPVPVCVDITGFLHPHILLFLKYFKMYEVPNVEFVYTEPEHYSHKVDTQFSLDEKSDVRQVAGFEGEHLPAMEHDVLMMGIGYEHNLMGQVIATKESARLVQVHCFPPISPDMYQESILRLDRLASASARSAADFNFFTTGNDPYVTAAVLGEAVFSLYLRKKITNLYLCPLSTKPQALGFGLFYLTALEGKPASIIYPFVQKYSRQHSQGVGRSWIYPVTF
ncbi:hypothetical protein GOD94_27635 [Sinorhizobium medicae]|nr:hypothetical protein [Sinorhizobium medicae]MDX0876606.1 hypothetical protein [Sinorhizobium medicae]